jgi:hypothetical protein
MKRDGKKPPDIGGVEESRVNQERDTFGPEAVSGKHNNNNPQRQHGKPRYAVYGPQIFDKGPDNRKKEKEKRQGFQNDKISHDANQSTTLKAGAASRAFTAGVLTRLV